MINKVIIGMLVILVVLVGSLGAYSYTLNQQVNDLSEQLTSSQAEQATLIGGVTDELTAFKGEALDAIDHLGEGIEDNIAEIGGLEDEIVTLGGEIDKNLAKLSSK
ncbi:hypothetical protein ACFLU1_02110 [Chloroflexota bacterium]